MKNLLHGDMGTSFTHPPASGRRPVGAPARHARAHHLRAASAASPWASRSASSRPGTATGSPTTSPASSRCSARRCRRSGPACCCCTCSTRSSAGCPGPGRIDPRGVPPDKVTGFYTIDSLLTGDFALFKDSVMHLILPAIVLGWGVVGIVSRLVRASLLDEFSIDYVRVARAMGLRERTVVNTPRAAQRAAAHHHHRRVHVRVPAHRRGAHRDRLLLAGRRLRTRSRRRATWTTRRSSASRCSAARHS